MLVIGLLSQEDVVFLSQLYRDGNPHAGNQNLELSVEESALDLSYKLTESFAYSL